jgi:superfamily II DNA/RNA helicase
MEIERLEKLPAIEDVEVEEIDMSAWARLRLHPFLMKALMKLKFSKPTPIQEACIAAAAYQGKVGCQFSCLSIVPCIEAVSHKYSLRFTY